MARPPTIGLTAWADRLSDVDLPVMAGVLKKLNELTDGSDSSAEQLAAEIKKDAALAAQVLKIANSVLYHPGADVPFKSINRAVVQLGFPGVRAICISVMMIDSLLGNQPREELLQTMARGFHSAVQARNLLAKDEESSREEAFVSALMMRIGDMAFWSLGGKQAETFADLIDRGVMDIDEASKRVMGTNLRSISLALAKRWGLGNTLVTSLASPRSKDRKVRAVVLGDMIAKTAEKGWDSPEFSDVLIRASKFSGLGIVEMKASILESAAEASQVAMTYGVQNVSHLIPNSAEPAEVTVVVKHAMKEDAQFQLDVLRELSDMVAKKTDVNTIFQTVIEGLHRGVGLERVAILLLNRSGRELACKYALGDGTENWRDDFSFAAGREEDNIFAFCLESHNTFKVNGKKDPDYRNLLTLDCLRIVKGEFLLASIQTSKRDIGVFYADKGRSDSTVVPAQFESFEYFVREANAGLDRLTSGNTSANSHNKRSH